MVSDMNRQQVTADVEERHQRRTSGVRRVIASAPDTASARDRLRDVIHALPGVSADPHTVPDIMFYVDLYVSRRDQLSGRTDIP
jgi:hypothetical protein